MRVESSSMAQALPNWLVRPGHAPAVRRKARGQAFAVWRTAGARRSTATTRASLSVKEMSASAREGMQFFQTSGARCGCEAKGADSETTNGH